MAIRKATQAETVEQTFARWLEDGDTAIGVFENMELGHHDLGRRVAFPYAKAQLDDLGDDNPAIGILQAPDHASIGLGWRYRLVAVALDVETALLALAAGEEPLA